MIRIHEGYEVKPHKETPTCYVVAVAGKGGSIPDILSGLYTSPVNAIQAIDKYLETKPKKVAKDA